ncbi:hypothetical protein BGZ80_006874 [Entomortierella chlamydospora]|uniref:F-box domain protein n=1 Tax=Entomortierella chlamydospora TaxID=101097 RepID=A0A9P6SSN2_9FUNG|nr:hypothetical protein BGZ80_006874 [Entomortierella chlamydospora]
MAVPPELVRKYARHIRILNNFKRPDYKVFPDMDSLTSCVEAFTNLIEYSGNDVDILMRNQGLRRLTIDCFGDYLEDPSVIWDILRPISSTLVELHTYDDSFLRGRKDVDGDVDDDHELVLPKLRVLKISLPRVLGAAKSLPKVCPNLEKLDNHNLNGWFFDPLGYIEHDDLEEIFRSRSCPKLNKLNITTNLKDDRLLPNLLNSHPGFHELGLGITGASEDCERAIERHAGTLTSFHLTIARHEWETDFLFNILRSCDQLTFLHVGLWVGSIEGLLDRKHWKNSDCLESLSIDWKNFQITLKLHGRRLPPTEGVMSVERRLEVVEGLGWKVHGDLIDQDMGFLDATFALAEGFRGLKTISLNGVQYRKISSS